MKIATTSQPISKKAVLVLVAFRFIEPEGYAKLHIPVDDQVSDSQKYFPFTPFEYGYKPFTLL